jgi:hypothetical protein
MNRTASITAENAGELLTFCEPVALRELLIDVVNIQSLQFHAGDQNVFVQAQQRLRKLGKLSGFSVF